MINGNYYSYSASSKSAASPAKQSIHESFPKELRDMFDQAFMASVRPKAAKWRDLLRQYADPSSGKLIRCAIEPTEHAHFDQQYGCGWCKLDEATRKPTRRKSGPKQSKPRTRTTRTSRTPLSGLSRIQGRTYFLLTLLSAAALYFAPLFLPPNSKEGETQAVQKKLTTQAPPTDLKKNPAIKLTAFKASGFLISDTNLRSGPGATYSIIMTIPKGTEVHISGRVDGRPWYFAALKAKTTDHVMKGFLHQHYLAILK
jgi:hypothetical protein